MWHPKACSDTVSGLRTRFSPRSRLGHGFVSMAPWVDLILVLLFFMLLRDRYLIEPGVVVELPSAPLRGGAPAGMVAMVLSLESEVPGAREEVVVFNDQRYRVGNEQQMLLLQEAMMGASSRDDAGMLLLEADGRVSHGTLVRLYAMAREVGLKEVNVAARVPR